MLDDGYKAAVTNDNFLTNTVLSTDAAVKATGCTLG